MRNKQKKTTITLAVCTSKTQNQGEQGKLKLPAELTIAYLP